MPAGRCIGEAWALWSAQSSGNPPSQSEHAHAREAFSSQSVLLDTGLTSRPCDSLSEHLSVTSDMQPCWLYRSFEEPAVAAVKSMPKGSPISQQTASLSTKQVRASMSEHTATACTVRERQGCAEAGSTAGLSSALGCSRAPAYLISLQPAAALCCL